MEPSQDVEQIEKNKIALALLARWDAEDAAPDAPELAQRETEWQEFKAALNDSHTSGRIMYP